MTRSTAQPTAMMPRAEKVELTANALFKGLYSKDANRDEQVKSALDGLLRNKSLNAEGFGEICDKIRHKLDVGPAKVEHKVTYFGRRQVALPDPTAKERT